ncbi:hypothetical protein G6022_14765, partial [Dietzia sp. Cai40]|uniref:hypothetical protein n=1 Tax=Dietzia sp. Cai40 TaxID=1630635 RepID=UPI0019D5DCDD
EAAREAAAAAAPSGTDLAAAEVATGGDTPERVDVTATATAEPGESDTTTTREAPDNPDR